MWHVSSKLCLVCIIVFCPQESVIIACFAVRRGKIKLLIEYYSLKWRHTIISFCCYKEIWALKYLYILHWNFLNSGKLFCQQRESCVLGSAALNKNASTFWYSCMKSWAIAVKIVCSNNCQVLEKIFLFSDLESWSDREVVQIPESKLYFRL